MVRRPCKQRCAGLPMRDMGTISHLDLLLATEGRHADLLHASALQGPRRSRWQPFVVLRWPGPGMLHVRCPVLSSSDAARTGGSTRSDVPQHTCQNRPTQLGPTSTTSTHTVDSSEPRPWQPFAPERTGPPFALLLASELAQQQQGQPQCQHHPLPHCSTPAQLSLSAQHPRPRSTEEGWLGWGVGVGR